MEFVNSQIYHVFNRSNDSKLVFPERGYYLYFLSKINEFIRPHAEILAWCLMPTHFHLMIEVEHETIAVFDSPQDEADPMNNAVDPMNPNHRINFQNIGLTHPMNSSHRIRSKKAALHFRKEALCFV